MKADENLSLRVTRDITKRADVLKAKMAKDPTLAIMGRVTRSAVLKLAIARGLEVLEREHGAK